VGLVGAYVLYAEDGHEVVGISISESAEAVTNTAGRRSRPRAGEAMDPSRLEVVIEAASPSRQSRVNPCGRQGRVVVAAAARHGEGGKSESLSPSARAQGAGSDARADRGYRLACET
jgi:hypothetical protein